MPQQLTTAVENNFTKGLITESTGLNFPENAATDCDNCEFTLIGDTLRREGINIERNGTFIGLSRGNQAESSYKWNNVGGDGSTQIVVRQVGPTLYFYRSSSATSAAPLSTTLLASLVDISSFVASGGSFDITLECQYADGNGYLFVYHPSCDPFYCAYNSGVLTGTRISVMFRDFAGYPEPGVPDTQRPSAITSAHMYNLQNQGWRNEGTWAAGSTTVVPLSSLTSPVNVNNTFTTSAGLPIVASTPVKLQATIFDSGGGSQFISNATGVVISYNIGTGSLVINTNPIGFSLPSGTITSEQWGITPINPGGQVPVWTAAVGGYPSNADVWWRFKDSSGAFNPIQTIGNVTLSTPAPKGSFILSLFNQDRNTAFGGSGLVTVTTTVRPRIGAWFQGRVWYAGTDAGFSSSGVSYSWTETIYFSQVVESVSDFGKCYQVNDSTSDTLFDLLPTDGGTIQIQGCGNIYKLFPIQNGMLVFAANGIWFITGSQGIGFSANDYTITKLSAVQSISSTSFVNVNGLPYFWNEEGIYNVQPDKGGTLTVEPITVGTILTFYNSIPVSSKKYARGDYHPIDYNIQWTFKDAEAFSVYNRYSFNRILNFNTYNKAFYPYSIDNSDQAIQGVIYLASPGGSSAPDPAFKYLAGNAGSIFIAEEYDEDYIDWGIFDYTSYFVTGYKLRGQAIHKFQPQYIQMYSRTNGAASGYKIQGIWDYSNNRNSGRWSTVQTIINGLTRFDTVFRRHKIRGQGFALQFKVSSITGMPFDIQGWAVVDTVNTGT